MKFTLYLATINSVYMELCMDEIKGKCYKVYFRANSALLITKSTLFIVYNMPHSVGNRLIA